MKSVRKLVKRLVVGGVLVVVLALVAGVVWIDRVAKTGVEAGGSYAFGVPTRLDSASIGIVAGRSKLSGLDIANPAGFNTPHLLKLDNAVVGVSLGSLTGDTVEIPEFSLSGIDVNLESQGGRSNFKVVMDNLGRFESAEKDPQAKKEEGRKFVIREIIVKDVKVNLALSPIGGSATRATIPIEELRLKNVGTGSGGGAILGQVAGTLLKAILMAAIEKGAGTMPAELLNDLNGALAGLTPLAEMGTSLAVNVNGTLKDLSTQVDAAKKQIMQPAADVAKQLGDTAKDMQQKLPGGLGDLLKKKDEKAK
jgi:hypothetical protein